MSAIGNNEIKAIFIGSVEVVKGYVGSNVFFNKTTPPVVDVVDYYVSNGVGKDSKNNYNTNFYVGDNLQKI